MAFPPFQVPQNAVTQEIITNGIRTISPYSFAQSSYDFMGGMWAATIDLSVLEDRDRATFLRWIASLDGPFGSFEMLAFDYEGPFGQITSNPTIAADASARSKTLSIDLAVDDALTQDDRITIDGHLHIVTVADVPVSDVQSIEVWPRLRADVTQFQAVEALAPYATWALAQPRNSLRVDVSGRSSASLELVEVI